MKQEIKLDLSGSFAKLGGRSLFRVEVLRLHPLYGMLDIDDAEDRKDIPYQGTDSVMVERVYEVYALEEAEVMAVVNEAVETVKDFYRIRVHNIPLGIRMNKGDTLGLKVFNSKGEKMGKTVDNRFELGEIVEYYDSEDMEIRLAVVWKIIDHSEGGDRDGNQMEYRLLTREHEMMPLCVQATDISAPSFPVSETFRKELEDLYRRKLESAEKGRLSFAELLDLL